MTDFLATMKDENFKLLPQQAVKSAVLGDEDPRNACWDMMITKSGRCFITICAEQHVASKAGLYEYDYKSNQFSCCFELADKVCQFHDSISMSKIHTSMCELDDGRIIMTTHTTAQSVCHPYWHPEPFYNHCFEGYQGSLILIYDPVTGKLENRGVPVPHESIYGAKYDPKHNCLYFTGYFRGHLYRFDLDGCGVTDYGQVTEFGSFRLHLGCDGNIYLSSRSGNFIRVNTDSQQIEELGIFFPKDYEPYSTCKHTTLNYILNGPDGYMYLAYIFSKNIYRFNPRTLELTAMGSFLPESVDAVDPNAPFAMVFDGNGVLWYAVSSFDQYFQMTGCQLCRWDLIHGGRPVNKGILGTKLRTVLTPSEGHFYNGIYYIGDSNHNFDRPGIIAVDLTMIDSLNYDVKTAELEYAADVMSYSILQNPKNEYHYSEDEYRAGKEHHAFFYQYMADYEAFLADNNFSAPCKSVKQYPLWKKFGAGKTGIYQVSFEKGEVIADFGNKNMRFRFSSANGNVQEIPVHPEYDTMHGVHLEDIRIPAVPGRRFKAVTSCAVQMGQNHIFVGTEDGLMGIYDGEKVFSLGSCPSCSGRVTDVCYCETTDTVFGIIGGKHDIGIVFSYNERNGIIFWGRMFYNTPEGLCSSFELSCIAVSADGKKLAVGNRDRLGVLYVLEI